MTRNVVDVLYSYFSGNEYIIHPSIVYDLFGFYNWTNEMKEKKDETLSLFLGLFKGLMLNDVSQKEIHFCYLTNSLDDLLNITYLLRPTGYFKEYEKKQIKIGTTFYEESKNPTIVCNSKHLPKVWCTISPPYHLEDIGRDHRFCKKFDSVFRNDDTDDETVSDDEQYYSFEQMITNKIRNHRYADKKSGRINYEHKDYVCVQDVINLAKKQDNKCYICCDKLLLNEYSKNCLYQFSIDRVNNKLPHTRTNILLSCYYCNCFSGIINSEGEYEHKICPKSSNCHIIKRTSLRKRNDVSMQEISKLLLN